MTNKEFRTEQLLEAGWTEKTPNSGYWHRPGVSKYFAVDRAYELELRFPEQVRATFLKINPLTEFSKGVGSDLNPDSTNASIIDKLQNQMRSGMQAGLDGRFPTMGRALGSPYGHGMPRIHVLKEVQDEIREAAAAVKPRYRVTGNGFYDVVVDNHTGLSIRHYLVNASFKAGSRAGATIECARLNRVHDAAVAAYAPGKLIEDFFRHPGAAIPMNTPVVEAFKFLSAFTQASPEYEELVKITIENINAEISYLSTLRGALWNKEMGRVKVLLSQKLDARNINSAASARRRLTPCGLLRKLGLDEK
jgi:hypothetical protein